MNFSPAGNINTYPSQTMSTLPEMWYVEGMSGKSWTVLLNGDAQVGSVATRYAKHEAGQNILVVLNGGQSDLLAPESQSGAGAYADMLTYCTALRARGVDKIIVCTMNAVSTAFAGSDITPQINEYNTLVRAGNALYDAVADVAAVPGLANPLDTSMYSDGAHYTEAGAALAAAVVRPVIATVSASLT